MIISMTGFASYLLTIDAASGIHMQLSITIKSLNSRFFEANCKLPYALTHLETECIKLFKQRLRRGYITFTIQASNPAAFKGPVQAEEAIVKSYLDACTKLQKKHNIPGTITINDIIQLPAAFALEEQTVDDYTKQTVLDSVNIALDQLVATRKIEGEALQRDLEQRVATLQSLIDEIEPKAHMLMEQRKQEITQRIGSLDNSLPSLHDSQKTALYLELDKIDIHEEIIRFKNHLQTFKNNILSDEIEKGRKLDFILQELSREINTIAAKCNDMHISSLAINAKVDLEKAREQVQNVV